MPESEKIAKKVPKIASKMTKNVQKHLKTVKNRYFYRKCGIFLFLSVDNFNKINKNVDKVRKNFCYFVF